MPSVEAALAVCVLSALVAVPMAIAVLLARRRTQAVEAGLFRLLAVRREQTQFVTSRAAVADTARAAAGAVRLDAVGDAVERRLRGSATRSGGTGRRSRRTPR